MTGAAASLLAAGHLVALLAGRLIIPLVCVPLLLLPLLLPVAVM